jgi:hypothetical protein
MIIVSNDFKKAIKDSERRIKGYVEAIYDVPDVTVTPTASYTSTYSSISDIVNGIRVEKEYGSLDYLPLDGSRLTVLNGTNDNAGYISDDLFEEISNPTITLSFASTTIKGMTLYFKDNAPTSLTLTYSDSSTQTITDNENEVVQIIFEEPKALTGVTILINDMEYSDRKIKLWEVDLGITNVYKDRDLIEFTVDEEVNKLVEEVPINETNIILNNMNDLFNPLNPTGIVPYLSENSIIRPYVGVLTETDGVEYVKMGDFYFESYTNNSDSTTTLVGKNIIKRLEKELLKNDNETDFFKTSLSQTAFETFMSNYNYPINTLNWSHGVSSVALDKTGLLDFLKEMTFSQWNIMYADRDNKLNFKAIDTSIKETLTKNELLEDVSYKNIDKINTVRLMVTKTGSGVTVTNREVLSTTVTLSNASEVFLIESSSPQLALATLSQTGGTSASIISQGMYMAFVKVQGNVGDTVTLKFESTHDYNPYKDTQVKTNNKEPEIVLEFDSFANYLPAQYIQNSNILDIAPSYEMSFDYSGDPSIEAGDYINVETPYGYKPLFVQKNRIKFDGGLEGSIEGVE